MTISDKLIYEKVIWIKYETSATHGSMVVKSSFYDKKQSKFKRAFKNCNIYYMAECILTPEKLGEIENETKRVHGMETC